MAFCLRIVAGLLLAVSTAVGAEIGQIKTISGDVVIVRDDDRHRARLGEWVEPADTIITGPDGSVGITFIDNSRLSTGPDSLLELARFRFDPTTHEGEFFVRFGRGTLAVVSGKLAKESPEAMTVETPISILGVRGTDFLVKVEK